MSVPPIDYSRPPPNLSVLPPLPPPPPPPPPQQIDKSVNPVALLIPTDQPPPPLPVLNLPPLNIPPPNVPPPNVPPPQLPYPPTYPPAYFSVLVQSHGKDQHQTPSTSKDYGKEKQFPPSEQYPYEREERHAGYYRSLSKHSENPRHGYGSPPRYVRSPSRQSHHSSSRHYRSPSPGYRSSSRHDLRSPPRYMGSPPHHHRSPHRHGSSRHGPISPPRHSSSRHGHFSPPRHGHRSPPRYIRRSPIHHLRSPSRHSHRSPSRHSYRSPSRHSYRSPSRQSYRSPSRQSHRSPSRQNHRSPSRHSRHYSPSRIEYERRREYERMMSSKKRSHEYDRKRHDSPHAGSHRGSARDISPHRRHESQSRKPLTDREKILEQYRKNYCRTSEDLIEKMEQWSKEHHSDEEESRKWYRCSPAELYYTSVGDKNVKQTPKLQRLCDTFFKKLILRGRNARPEVDELPPLKPTRGKMCKHKSNNSASSSSSSSSCSDDDYIDEDSFEGITDRIMLELQRKQNHPRRLHPEMWFNNTGEMNGGPLCRCSAKARRHGMRHGVYAGEQTFPRCKLNENNINKLFHYRITVSPPTNFLIKSPTIISHDEHEFLFSGFSLFSHYKLAKLPSCKVIRFNIEYTILFVEEPAPQNFSIQDLDLFEEYLFIELLELIDLDLGKATETACSQFHFMPRFVRYLSDAGCEILSMSEVLKYLVEESDYLIPPDMLDDVHGMDHYTWQKFVDRKKGMIVTYPGKKPCSVRVDQLDRSPPAGELEKNPDILKTFFPEIVHFGIRPPQLSYAGNPEYQKAWRYYVKYRHLIANMAKPSFADRQKLAAKQARLQEMRTQSKMKRDVTVAISSEGFYNTGLMCDVVQHAMLIPVLVRHLRFHKSLECLEKKIGYVFKQRLLLQTALTHPSYRENFGTNPDHARNSLTNCGIRQPEYGDRRIHYARKKGIVTLINIMSRFGRNNETTSDIKHNERLEFLGDAVVEFLSSVHLFRMFPGLAEGGLATYRAAIVQNQHLAQLAKNIELEEFMLYAHGSDLCRDVVMRHAMANCFEALMGALFLDAGLEVADRVFALALWYNDEDLLDVWTKFRAHPLQEQEPLGDRKYIKDFEFLQKLTEFEQSIGVQFKHIRLLARAFTDRSVGFTHLTLGSNQRLEFLGDTVLQLLVSDRLYRHFPDHHEGHLSLLRSSLVNKRTQALVCDDLNMSVYAIYNNPKAKPTTKKHKADLLEAFLGALFVDKNLEYCQAFCNAVLFPRLQEFIMNQDWNDPKSKLQQCCLTLRSMEGGEPDIPLYKVIECLGPTNTRVYTVGVYFRGARLASARGHSIQEAEMNAAEQALSTAHELFPQLDHQKRVIAKSMKKKKNKLDQRGRENKANLYKMKMAEKVPKAYRLDKQSDSSEESSISSGEHTSPEYNSDNENDKSDEDSGLDSEADSVANPKLDNVEISSLVSDMEKIKADLIKRNEYEKLKEKCKNQSDSDDE